MSKYNDFRDMNVWQLGIKMLKQVYEITKTYPEDERFNLISDMRRAINSVCHNVAEGYGRYEPKDKTRFYKISRGSAYELISQIAASEILEYISLEKSERLIDENKVIIGELTSLINSIENKGKKS